MVNYRIDHLELYEDSLGNLSDATKIERNTAKEADTLTCPYSECNKVCKSKAGLMIHIKRIHADKENKVTFTCEKCQDIFKTEGNLKNHLKKCDGDETVNGKKKCSYCHNLYAKSGFAKHKKSCKYRPKDDESTPKEITPPHDESAPTETTSSKTTARKYIPKKKTCQYCKQLLSATNMARHEKKCATLQNL